MQTYLLPIERPEEQPEVRLGVEYVAHVGLKEGGQLGREAELGLHEGLDPTELDLIPSAAEAVQGRGIGCDAGNLFPIAPEKHLFSSVLLVARKFF